MLCPTGGDQGAGGGSGCGVCLSGKWVRLSSACVLGPLLTLQYGALGHCHQPDLLRCSTAWAGEETLKSWRWIYEDQDGDKGWSRVRSFLLCGTLLQGCFRGAALGRCGAPVAWCSMAESLMCLPRWYSLLGVLGAGGGSSAGAMPGHQCLSPPVETKEWHWDQFGNAREGCPMLGHWSHLLQLV